MWCLTRENKLNLSILVFLPVFQMNKKSKCSAVLHHTWLQKLWERLSSVVHQLIYMLRVFFCSHSSVDSSHIEVKTTKSCTVKLLQENSEFLITCHSGQEASLWDACKLMLMTGPHLQNYGQILGFKTSTAIQQLINHLSPIQVVNHILLEGVKTTNK